MTKEPTKTPVLDLLAEMTADSIEATDLDERELMLVRFAALIASDAPPASYLLNIGAASDAGLDEQDARDVLAAIAPIVGTARTVSALSKITRALGLAIEIAELADQEEIDSEV